MSKKAKEEQKEDGISSKSILGDFLKSNKDDHYNFEESVNYKVSTGSLNMDMQTGGGLGPGLHRFVGFTEGGKTSASLRLCGTSSIPFQAQRAFILKPRVAFPQRCKREAE